MRKETSILLPAGKVDLFLKDAKTIEAAKALSNDWRFARVVVNVHDGNVERAIAYYDSAPSPDLILIETDTTDEGFIGLLGQLSGKCDEGTSAIVIGPVNDVNLYRSLTAMGVSDYLVRPVPLETLSEVIASSLIEKLGTSGSRLVAMIGSKGGVGVSSLSQALAWGASTNLSQKTFLFDAAGAWSSLGVGLGFEPAASTKEAVKAVSAKDTDSFRRMLYHPNDRLSVLATGSETMLSREVTPQQYEEILNTAMVSYPLVIADLSGADNETKKAVLARAHEIIVVATPTLSSLRGARTLMQEIRKIVGDTKHSIDLIINMSGIAAGKEVSKADITAAMDVAPSAVIPYDVKNFIAAETEGRRIGADKGGQAVVDAILPFVQKLVSREPQVETSKPLGNVLGFLDKLKSK